MPVQQEKQRHRVAPIALHEASEVPVFLDRLGLGRLDPTRITSSFGRNDIWAGTTDSGHGVFVKRLVGPAEDVRARVRRVAAVDELLRDARYGVPSPRCLGVDEDLGLVATQLLDGAENGADLYDAGDLTESLSAEMGEQVGLLHRLTPPADLAVDHREPHRLPPGTLRVLPLAHYGQATAAELEIWRLLHNDAGLAAAVAALADRESMSGRRALVHGDLRLDQFLRHDGRLYLTDWEECRIGDPARDIGAIAGEWLFRAVNHVAETEPAADDAPDDDWLVRAAVTELQQVRPRIAAFWLGYRKTRGDAANDQDLVRTATATAGWHLIDRMFAVATRRPRLLAVHRAAAGVGRKLLTQPELFTSTIGLVCAL